MAFVSKTLGQANPGPVLTNLYVTPNGAQSTVTIVICNLGGFADTYRVSIAPAGAVDHPRQYIAYNKIIEANVAETINNIYVKAGDIIRVWGSVTDLSFTAMGTENG